MPRKQKKRILRAKRRDWYKRLLDRRNAVSAHRPRFEELEPKMLLSGTTFYADDFTFADVTVDNGSGVLDAGDVVALTDFGGGTAVFGTDAFDTISAAISAAGADDIVRVGAGTFVEGPQIQISSNLDLVGQGAGVTIIEAGGNTTTSGDGRGWFLVDEGVNLNVSNMTFDGAGNLIWQAFRHRGSGTFDSVAFNDIAYQASGSPYGGTAIAAFGSASDIEVLNSSFTNIGRIGVLYFGSGVTGTFADNTYTGKGAGDWLDYALDISAGANIEVSGNTISNNLGVAISDGSTSAGVLVSTFFGAGTTADIHNNTLTGNTTGVAVGFDGSDTSSVTISGNDLSGNGNGVSSTAPTVDASGNWWGTNDEATIAGLVVGDVDFSPYLDSGADTSGDPGFQGDTSMLRVTALGAQAGVAGRVQETVDSVDAGGTVVVNDGTFVGNVQIGQSVTLLSQNGAASTTLQGIAGAGALGTVHLLPGVNDVILGGPGQGFAIMGINGNGAIENAAVYLQGNHSNIEVRNNEIIADGDAGLMSEFGATVTAVIIDGNTFSGQTFTGANPGGIGFSTQFNVGNNVPRQLVVMGGGTGGGNTSNITFSNNQVTGTAGGISSDDLVSEQGNTLVTIDVAGAIISGNTFAGTTTRFGSSLRARGTGTVITGNHFDGSGQTPTTNFLFLANPGTANDLSTDPTGLDGVIAGNTFDPNVFFVDGGNTVFMAASMQAVIDAAAPGTALRFSGTFTEDVDVNKALLVGGDFTLNGELTLSVAGATLSAGFSPGIIASGNLSLTSGSTLDAEINGLTPGTGHDQYVVTGTVDLGGATLNATGTIAASVGDSVILIDNDLADAVTGTFAGLAQGDTLVISGDSFLINYAGGDGNDVELVRVPNALDTLYVDDDFVGTPFGADPDGAGPAQVFGYNAFATIQEAINAADNGATIYVLEGTYNEALSINKSVDLIGDAGDALEGEGASAPVLDGTSLFGVFGATITGGSSDVMIEGFTFANWFTGGVSVEDGHVTLSHSSIDGALVGVSVDGGSADVQASVLTNAGIFGIEVVSGGSTVVTGSQITNANTAGVSVSTGSANISQSILTGNGTGLLVGATGSATVFGSSLGGNTIRAISNSAAAAVNASGNYWGVATQAGVAAQTLGNVDFTPFLNNGTDTDAAAAGFQGDFSAITVTTLGTQTGGVGRVKEGVAVADAGGTVNVLSGTYVENSQVLIDKDLSIAGQGTKPVITPGQNFIGNNAADAWLLVDEGVTFGLNNVVLDGNGFFVWQGLRSHGNTTVDSVDFRDITGSASGSPYRGVAVQSYGGTVGGGAGADSHGSGAAASHLVVQNSTFQDIGRIGVLVKGDAATADIVGNDYTGKGAGDWLDYAFEAGSGAKVDIIDNTVTGNLGVASSDGSTSAGVLATTYWGVGTEVDLSGNNAFSGNTDGIYIGYGTTDSTVLTVTGGSFTGNADSGIHVGGTADAQVHGATVTGNNVGISAVDGATLLVDSDTELSGNQTGVLVASGADATISDNDNSIHGNLIGVDVDGGSAAVSNNHIYDNTTAVRFINGGGGSVEGNDFDGGAGDDNTTDLLIDASAGTVTIDANNAFAGDTFYIDNQGTQDFDLSANGTTFDEANNFRIEDKVHHVLDTDLALTTGLVTWVADNVYVTDAGTDHSVQRGVDAADAGDTVNVEDGLYVEQLSIAKNLTLLGQSELGTVIQAPPAMTLANSFVYSGQTKQSVIAITGGDVTVQNLTVDGNAAGNTVVPGNDFNGIGIHNADATIQDVTVTSVRDSALAGTQRGRAIFAGIDDAGPHTVAVIDSTIEDYQKNGLDLRGTGLTVNITGNDITGAGDTTLIAQNGIVLLGGATGTISGNTISGHMYSGGSGGPNPLTDTQSTGILLFDAGSGVVIDGNTIDGNDIGVYSWGGTVQISNNILGSTTANRYEGILVDQSVSTLTGNDITGGNIGVALVTYGGAGGDSDATLSGNTITGATVGVQMIDDDATASPVLTVGAGNTISGGTTGLLIDGAGNTISGLTLNDLTFAGQSGDYVTLANGALDNLVVDASAVTVDGTTGASLTPTQLAAAEAKITDALDDGSLGRILLQSGTIIVTPTSSATALDNDYTRIRNAIEVATDGDTIMLMPNGIDSVFNWDEPFALASWALGNDGIASTDDDWGVLLPDGLDNVTVTADPGDNISIQGPGDVTTANLEGVFVAFDNGTNTGWTFENFGILDFDNAIGFYFSGDDYSGLTVNNMHIRVAADSSADANQNIGIHYARGSNISITNNLFELVGGGDGTTFAIQSNTHGGTNYDGLSIIGNDIVVLNAGDENIYGVWENGHAHLSNIDVSGNSFTGAAGNAGTQTAFRITSHSGASSTVSYDNNVVDVADVAFDWLDIYFGTPQDYTGTLPIEMNGNTVTNTGTAYDIGGINASANINGGSVTGASGIGVNIADGNSASVSGVTLQNLDIGILVGGSATITGNFFDNASDNLTDIQVASTASGITIGAGNTFGGDNYYIENLSGLAMNLVGLGSAFDEVDNFRVEDKLYHATDDASSGLIRVVAGNLYVTTPGTGLSDELIQNAIDAADANDTVNIEAGTYAENLTIGKDINLLGQAGLTTLTPAGAGNLITIAGSGFGDDETVRIQNIDFDGSAGTASAGVFVGSGADFANLIIENGDFTGFNLYGIAVFGNATTGLSVQDVDLTNLTFSNNGIGGGGGTADIQMFEYNGDATLTDLVLVGNRNEGLNTGARGAIQFRGVGAGSGAGVISSGTIALDNVDITGTYRNQMIGIQRYTDVSGLSFNDVALGGVGSDLVGSFGAALRFDAVGDIGTKGTATPTSVDLGNTYFRGLDTYGATFDIEFAPDNTFGWLRADGTDTQWDTNLGTQVAASSLTLDELFEVEDRILHYVEPDHPTHLSPFKGFVDIVDGTSYITETYGSLINRGIEMIDEGGTVFIDDGTYAQSVTVNKAVSLVGSGQGATTITEAVVLNAADTVNRMELHDLSVLATDSPVVGASRYAIRIDASAGDTAPVTIQNVTARSPLVNGVYGSGILVTLDTNTVDDVIIESSTIDDSYTHGLYMLDTVGTTGALTNLSISNSSFSDNDAKGEGVPGLHGFGMVFQNGTNAAQTVMVDGVNISNTVISGNHLKGIYAESMNNAIFDTVTITNNGTTATSGGPSGLELNLKYEDFSNIQILDAIISGNGTGAANGAGLAIKARGSGVDSASYTGNPASLTGVLISGGTYDGNQTGIRIGEPGQANTSPTDVTITGVTVSNSIVSGIDLVGGNTTVTASDLTNNPTGIRVINALATIIDNPNTITGGNIGIDVDGGTALIENNDLNGNTIGVLIRNGGLADLGDVTGSDITGLGAGSGTNGSSAGLNDFTGFTTTATASSGAIIDLNTDAGLVGTQGLPADTPAFNNTWNDPDPAAIEDVVYHDSDDNNLAFVDFADLASLSISLDFATISEGGTVQLLGTFTNSPQDHTLTVNWGDGTIDIIAVPSGVFDLSTLNITHTYVDNGPSPSASPFVYPIGVTLVEDTGPGILVDNSLTATVNNVAPTVALSGAATTNESAVYTLTIGAVTDPGTDTVIQYRVIWGDGTFDVYTPAQLALSSGQVTHTYQDGPAGITQIAVELTDEDGIHPNAGILPLTVNNLDPFGTFGNGGPVDAGSPGFVTWFAQGDPSPIDASSLVYDYDFGDDGSFEIVGTTNNFATVPGSLLVTPGTYDVRSRIRDKDGGVFEQVTTITINPTTFRVLSLTPNASGFDVVFSGDLDLNVFNLYDGYDAAIDLPDLYVLNLGGEVAGSTVFNASTNTLSWVKTGGVLAPGNYSVFMTSGINAVKEAGTGALLDGDADGTPGDNYTSNFVVSASASRILSMPDFARGPGQTVDVPATGLGLPVTLSDASGVNAVDFDVRFDPSLLNITGATLGATLPGDWSITYNLVSPGHLKITTSGITTLSGTDVQIVNLTADVPASADFGGSQVIKFENLAVNGGFISSVADRAIHKAAYLGDVDGDFFFSGLDAGLISGVVVDIVSGFDAFDKTDPVILANSTGTGTLNGLDASYVAQKSVALPRPEIPDLPAIAPAGVPGEDPVLTVDSGVIATIGSTVSVPVNIDDADGLLGFNLDLSYDTDVLDLANGDVTLGGLLTTAGGWTVVPNVDDVTGEVKLAFFRAGNPMLAGGGEVVTLDFTVLPGAASLGVTPIAADGPTDLGGKTYNYIDGSINVIPITGDLNSDGFVGIDDLNIVLGNWNQNVTPGDWLAGDPTGDGFVGIADLNTVLGNWNAGTPPVAAASASSSEQTSQAQQQQVAPQTQQSQPVQTAQPVQPASASASESLAPAQSTRSNAAAKRNDTARQAITRMPSQRSVTTANPQRQSLALASATATSRSAFAVSDDAGYQPILGLWDEDSEA